MNELLETALDRCIKCLDSLLLEPVRSAFCSASKEDLSGYHYGLGTWIRNDWLQGEEPLYRLFLQDSVKSRDEMSIIIIKELHKRIQGTTKPFYYR